MTNSDFEVLIVAYRTVDQLAEAIASTRKYLGDITIRVWDNSGPDHPQVAEFSADHPDIDWHLGSANLGFAAAVNKLAALGTTPYFLLLNPDAVLLGDLAETRRLISGDRVAAAAPLILDPHAQPGRAGTRPWDVAHRRGNLVRALVDRAWYSPQLRSTPLSSLYPEAPQEVSGYLTGACLMINRAAWTDLGPFDEEFFLYGEEADWQRRAREAGWRLLLANEPGVTHAGEGTVSDDPRAGLRSGDLLRAGIALNLERAATVHHGDAYLAATSALDRVQRSARRRRAALAATYTGSKPSVILTTNRLVYGGAERHHVVLATELANRGYPVTIVCMQRFGPLVSEIGHNIRVVRQPWWAPLIDVPAGRSVTITGDTNTETGFGTLWRAGHRDRRWLAAAHWYPKTDRGTYSEPLARAMSRADGFVALSPAHWRGLTTFQSLGDRHFIAPNGVVSKAELPDIAPAVIRDSGTIRLAMLARIVELKNPHILTAALSKVPEHLDWTLDIFGDGPDRERLQALTPESVLDRVRWRGWSPGPDHALAQADLLCGPSGTEAFPLVILEAMARGIPVMATDVCSVPDILDDGAAGFIVPEPSVDAWAAALTDVLSHPERLPAVGAAGRARMAQQYTVDAMADAYEAAIDGVF
ncbi:glycosyltransferase [Gordonia sp. TBRC 11910]|uniref:Glycosyltransferase n=1 Tax=Gordonia asplenii TaxID=2725283 RepID=A0A848L5K4_9ACTN|nr:glycosyltransferase [Gordonia asplenii]NMO02898.1 glycosyltransferase [Gordonia asplenii]